MMPDTTVGFALLIVAIALGVPLLVYLFSTFLVKATEWSDGSQKRRRVAGLAVFGVYAVMTLLLWFEYGPGLRAYLITAFALLALFIALRPSKNPELAGLTRSEHEARQREETD